MAVRVIVLFFTSLVISACDSGGFKSGCGRIPEGNSNSPVRIIKVVANPPGVDSYNESFVIKNFGDKNEDLSGWKILNKYKNEWSLDNVNKLGPCEKITIVSVFNGALRNDNDTIRLIDDNDMLIQHIGWKNLVDGENVYPASGQRSEDKQPQ